MRTRGIYWIAQFVGWMAYGGLLLFAIASTQPSEVNLNMFLNLIGLVSFGVSITHFQRWMMIRWGWLNLKLVNLTPRLLLISMVSSFLINALLYALDFALTINEKSYNPPNISEFMIGSLSIGVLILFWNAIYFTFHFFQKSRNQEISNLELTASNRESELKNLRSQLNPHFLFNSLNSIRALVDLDPVKAKVSITTLSNLLRQSLILGRENKVTIEQELDISKSYLDLEKIRFEERLRVRWEIDDMLLQNKIPPFSIQMMVENSVKHGISEIKEGGEVVVTIMKQEEGFCIKVANSGVLGAGNSIGVGVQNIKKRLMLQYEDRADFQMYQEGGFVIAKINFNNEGI